MPIRPRRPPPIGRGLPGVEILVVDDYGTVLGPGGTGEVWVRGPTVMAGYYRDGLLYDLPASAIPTITKDIRHVTTADLQGFDAVVHLAELSNDPIGQNRPEVTYAINGDGSANLARKLPVVSGLLLASTIVAANYVPADDNVTVIAILSLAFFGQGMSNLGWTIISDVAPKKWIGLTAGIFNFSTNLAGIVTPVVVGVAYQWSGSFVGPLLYIGVVALVGAFSYLFILGDVHRLEIDTDP